MRKRLIHWFTRAFLCGSLIPLGTVATAAPIIDSINGSATPLANAFYGIAGNDIGWYYTPSFSYSLQGIYTDFPAVPGNALATPFITVQIQSERPINGGVVLGQDTFQGNSLTGGIEGVTFSPVSLVAGKTYFVDYLNINGMGGNVGQWANDSHGNPQPSNGATINLGTAYTDTTTSTGFASARPNGAFETFTAGSISLAEPILNFAGVVPEPSSVVLAGVGFSGLVVWCWRRERLKR
jgi:hypothetical protein